MWTQWSVWVHQILANNGTVVDNRYSAYPYGGSLCFVFGHNTSFTKGMNGVKESASDNTTHLPQVHDPYTVRIMETEK